MLHATRVLLTATAMPLFSCTSPPANHPTTVRDSAGITIVESTAPQWGDGEGWCLDPVPVLDLTETGTGPSHEFYRVVDATQLQDGRYAVADRGSGEIRIYTQTGEFVHALGGQGEGPGEFDRLRSIAAYRHDSIVAFDSWLRRVTFLSLDGGSPRTLSPFDRQIRIQEVDLLGDSLLLLTLDDHSDEPDENGLYRSTFRMVRVTTEGQALDTLAVIPGIESFIFPRGYAPLMFGRQGQVTTNGAQAYVGTADAFEYHVYNFDGAMERIVRVPTFDLRLTEEQFEAERNAFIALYPPDTPGWALQPFRDQPVRSTEPAYVRMLVDATGAVWLESHTALDDASQPIEWRVFGADGTWLGSVVVPTDFTMYEIGRDYVLGKSRDELDVEHVQVRRVGRDRECAAPLP